MRVHTVGHGTRPVEELLEVLGEAGVRTLVDVRRFPSSRRHPQFNQPALAASLQHAEIGYRHAVELGGRLSGEPGEERFRCIQVAAFRAMRPGWPRRPGRRPLQQRWQNLRPASSAPRRSGGAATAA